MFELLFKEALTSCKHVFNNILNIMLTMKTSFCKCITEQFTNNYTGFTTMFFQMAINFPEFPYIIITITRFNRNNVSKNIIFETVSLRYEFRKLHNGHVWNP